MGSPSIDWWIEKLENVRRVGDGYTALCPAHDDLHNSLSLKPVDGETLVHCFVGCSYGEIYDAVNSGQKTVTLRGHKSKVAIEGTARSWWEEYTQIPSGFWETIGVTFTKETVEFCWDGLDTRKSRLMGEKRFSWTPDGTPRPPLWPSIPDSLPERVWITEGESDCGVLRFIGLDAFALTKGIGSTSLLPPVWRALHEKGVREVVFISDLDEAGQKVLEGVAMQIRVATLEGLFIRLEDVVDPLLGEKDIRDLWIRLADPELLKRKLSDATVVISPYQEPERVLAMDFLRRNIRPFPWLVKDVVFRDTVGMIVGAPKLGKSWMALDLAISISSGQPYLGHYPVSMPGPVIYISKEDPQYSLQDRIAKILLGKGMGGTVEVGPGKISMKLPRMRDFPLYIDLSRGFLFSPSDIEELLDWLRRKKAEFGYISAVILDPILRMIMGIDEYKATEVNAMVFDPAIRIIQEIGCAVILVHHTSKGGSGSYGSVAFHAFSDSTQYLVGSRPSDDNWIPIRSEFKSAPEQTWALRFAELEETYRVEVDLSERSQEEAPDPIESDLVSLLEEKGPLPVRDIRSHFSDVSIYQIRTILKDLERRGLASREQEDSDGTGRPRDLWSAVQNQDDEDE